MDSHDTQANTEPTTKPKRIYTPAQKRALEKYYVTHREEIIAKQKLKNKQLSQLPEHKEKRKVYNHNYHLRLIAKLNENKDIPIVIGDK